MGNLGFLGNLNPFGIGFEGLSKSLTEMTQMAETVSKTAGYPPYNIVKVNDNTYRIEMAVAGFGRQDIELVLDGGKLTISGKSATSETEEVPTYLYKGIADRFFKRTFHLADTVQVNDAELLNGILRVWLENVIPESKRPKKIEVKDTVDPISELMKSECASEIAKAKSKS
jgi:molecular chaperone IbpA